MDDIIPKDQAMALCKEIREENKKKFILSFRRLMCWGCSNFTKNEDERCWNGNKDGRNRGCFQVNNRFDAQG